MYILCSLLIKLALGSPDTENISMEALYYVTKATVMINTSVVLALILLAY